jgi:hypothetical protein
LAMIMLPTGTSIAMSAVSVPVKAG